MFILRNHRVCRCGAGEEATPNECNTPGFPLSDTPQVKYDHRHCLKLYLKRNHNRLVQTSTDQLRSWRANCDIQLLIYSSDPKNPDSMDIARVTDYIVSYTCKGNITMKEEREQNKHLVLRYDQMVNSKSI